MESTHLIAKQILDLRFDDTETPAQCGEIARRTYFNVGIPVLQQVLDEVAPGREMLRIDRVVIDLGVIKSDNVEETFRKKLTKGAREYFLDVLNIRLNTELGRHYAVSRASKSDMLDLSAGPGQSGAPISWSGTLIDSPAGENSSSSSLRDRQQELIEFTLHFLEFGTAPWWSSISFRGDPESANKTGDAILAAFEENSSFRNKMRGLLGRHAQIVLQRIANESWLNKLVAYLRERRAILSAEDLVRLEQIAFELLPAGVDNDVDAGVLRHAFDRDLLLGFLAVSASSAEVVAARGNNAPKENGVINPEISSVTPIDIAPVSKSSFENVANDASAESEHSFFVDNAGVILLQPFIPLLFEELNITKGGEITSERNRTKAIRLLEYLTWGTTTRAEFSLRFEKLLCALPDHMPLADVDLSPAELAEADTVLDAAIQHWSALKNTGKDGLRSTFLQRNGKVEINDKEITLQVERQSVDYLLTKIPWSYSVLRFPWMAEIVTVVW